MTSFSWFSGNSEPSRKFMAIPLECRFDGGQSSGCASWPRSSSSRIGAPTHMLCSPCRLASCSTAVISSLRRAGLQGAPDVAAHAGRVQVRARGVERDADELDRLRSSAPETAGAIAIAMTFSVQAGSSCANGSQSGFQLPLARAAQRQRIACDSAWSSGSGAGCARGRAPAAIAPRFRSIRRCARRA